MPIVRRYSPPFQVPAPRPGAEDVGRAVKGLVNVEIKRTSEVSFAVESFGCDGKPVLSLLRDLPCESTDGKLTVAGTKNGMPFSLNSDLPRGLGSAIRGSGGSLRKVASGAIFRTHEWVLYDNFGNYWSLDELTGGEPTYRGETPPLYAGDGVTPALCVQAPGIRPYEKRWEYILSGGDPEVSNVAYLLAGAGWQDDADPAPVIAYPVAYPYVEPTDYWRVEQWIPDETTPPPGGNTAGAWPTSLRRVECEWYPGFAYPPHDYDGVTENSIDIIVSKYPAVPPWTVYMNRFTRPLVEHISTGGSTDEMDFIICNERRIKPAPANVYRVALREKLTGTLIGSTSSVPPSTSSEKVMFTPNKSEGWLRQLGTYTGTGPKVSTLHQLRSRATSTDNFGTALTDLGTLPVTLPAAFAHDWTEPVWFRVGKVTTYFGTSPTLTPLLPRWR